MKYFWHTRLLDKDPEKDSTGGGSDSKEDIKDTKEDTKEDPKEDPKEDAKEDAKEPPSITKSGFSVEDIKSLIEVFQSGQSVQKATESDTKEDPKEDPKADSKDTKEDSKEDTEADPREAALRKLLIKSANVPEELLELLPSDLSKLQAYLESPGYTKACQKLAAASKVNPPNGDNSEASTKPPKDKPNSGEFKPPATFKEITPDMLKQFDSLM